MYDIAIIGAGPAGFTAAIYAQRYNMKAIVFGDKMGGLVTENPFIENYPGLKLVDGAKLGEDMKAHAEGLGAKVLMEKVKSVEKNGKVFTLTTEWDTKVEAKTVLLSHGLKRRILDVPGEKKFAGKGVSGCATCDAAFFKGKVVGVIGGGDSAGVAALITKEFATKTYLIYRKDKFTKMQPPYVKKINGEKNIEVMFSDTVTEFYGKDKLEGVKLKSGKNLKLDGFFIEIGFEPEIPFEINFKVKTDQAGFIEVSKDQSTSEPGVFAAGDITNASNFFHQIATAVGEGSVAADTAHLYLIKND